MMSLSGMIARTLGDWPLLEFDGFDALENEGWVVRHGFWAGVGMSCGGEGGSYLRMCDGLGRTGREGAVLMIPGEASLF